MKCECGRTLGTNVAQTIRCTCGRESYVQPAPSRCPTCGVVSAGLCQDCEERKEEMEDMLEICETNECGRHRFHGGRHHCGDLEQPCRLTQRLAAGWKCERGYHDIPVDLSGYVAAPFQRADEVLLVTTHFNPQRYSRLRDTYYEWLPSLGPINVVCYELVLDDDEPEIDGSTVIRGTREKNVLWQKEALINRAFADRAPWVKYFGWLDHDIILTNPHWLRDAVELIDRGSPAVQMFNRIHFLNDRQVVYQRGSCGVRSHMGSPGGPWLTTVELFDQLGGLSWGHICGGGDQTWCHAVTERLLRYLSKTSPLLRKWERDWITRAWEVVAKRRSLPIESMAYHLFHGNKEDRQYRSRIDILTRHLFDPAKDVTINADGILEWAGKPDLAAEVAEYFAARKEDQPCES